MDRCRESRVRWIDRSFAELGAGRLVEPSEAGNRGRSEYVIASRKHSLPIPPDAASELRPRIAAAAIEARDFENNADLVLVIGSDRRLLYVSPVWLSFYSDQPDPVGRNIMAVIRAARLESDQKRGLEQAFVSALDGSGRPIPLRYRDAERGWRHLEGRLYGPRAESADYVAVFHDITARYSQLMDLQESERRYRTIADAAGDMVTETGADGRFTYVSPACTKVLGYPSEELVGLSPLRLHHGRDRDEFLEEVQKKREVGQLFTVKPHRLRCRDESWVWVEATGVRYQRPDGEVCLIGVARDITARLEAESARMLLEEQLRRTQKLETLGVLAGGIAHDFNNFLTPVVGTAALLLDDLGDDPVLRRRILTIKKAADRATDLTAQMLAYAGKTDPQLVPLDVSEAMSDIELLLESAAGRRADLNFSLDPSLPVVRADRVQIGQVVMNLVTNAAEALGPDSRRIDVRTKMLAADRDLLRTFHLGSHLEEGRHVCIEVSDDGEGIDESVRERIFDPFFSTKLTGRGLGLAVVLGIVQSHGGALQIESERGRGTTFRIILPPARGAVLDDVPEIAQLSECDAGWQGQGTVLVADDDAGARELTQILLERAGFDVLCAVDGIEAVEIFRHDAAEIVAVVLDNTMPGMSGSEALEEIRKLQPDVPIMLISGYTRERVEESLLARGGVRFLHKPFDGEKLLAVLRALLEPKASV